MASDFMRNNQNILPQIPTPTLWFEYLLNPSLLQENLNKPNSGIQAQELIVEFLINSITPNTSDKNEKVIELDGDDKRSAEKKSKKSLALKILALKCASYLNFNFSQFENKIPLPLQQMLFQDLLHFACDGKIDVKNHLEMDYNLAKGEEIFSVSMYHRWILWALRTSQIITKPKPILHIPMPGGQGPSFAAPQVVDGLLRTLEIQVGDSIKVLEKILAAMIENPLKMPSVETFVCLTETSVDESQRWEAGPDISVDEFHLQLHYDLAVWFMFTNNYNAAKQHFAQVAQLYTKLGNKTTSFCTIDVKKLRGFLLACRLPVDEPEVSLKNKMFQSIENDYDGFLSVLQEDNLKREIPVQYRDAAELDLVGSAASGKFTVAKDMIFKVQTLNVIRKAVDRCYVSSKYKAKLMDEGTSGANYLISNLENVVEQDSNQIKQHIKEFLLDLMLHSETIRKAVTSSTLKHMFRDDELNGLRQSRDQLIMQDFNAPFDFPKSLSPDIECGELVQRLIESYSLSEIQNLLTRLNNGWPNRSLWTLYSKWEIPIPLQSVIMILPKGLLQDSSYILLAKARELVSLKEYARAIEFHKAVEAEVRVRSNQLGNFNAGFKLSKLTEWEILLIEIVQILNDWPKSYNCELVDALSEKCRNCLGALSRGETVLPRSEVVEHCSALLLAAADWEFLLGLDLRWNVSVDLASKLAAVCYDIHHNRERPNRKLSRTLWDLVTPAFGPASGPGAVGSQGSKRTAGGSQVPGGSRDSPVVVSPVSRAVLNKFCGLLCDPLCLNVMMSMLSSLHNIVQDESNLEINVEPLQLWPAVLSGATSYFLNIIGETLHSLLDRAIGMYPSNTSWFKMQGDLYFAQGLHSSAMSSYVAAAAESSSYFSQVVPKHVLDDSTIRRMIRCCHLNQAFTQAAILCQFLGDVDYPTAFRCVQERNCNDTMDGLYPCIFDITLLEYIIQIHHKRGEFQRKSQAMKVIGTLELNASNNEEIQREAINSRKANFWRMLAKQYLRA